MYTLKERLLRPSMDAQDGVPSVGRPDPPEPPDGDRPSSSPFSRMTLFAFPISCVNSSQLPSTTAIPSLTVVATSREPRTSCLALPRFFKDPPCLQPFPIAFVRSSDMDAALNIRGSVDAPSSFTIRALLFLGSSTALPCRLPFPIAFVRSSDMDAAVKLRGIADVLSSLTLRTLLFLGSSTALHSLLPFPIAFVRSSDMNAALNLRGREGVSAFSGLVFRILLFLGSSPFLVYSLFPSPLCVAVTRIEP